MKVTAVRALPLVASLDVEVQKTALGGRSHAALVLVEVRTDDGLVGYGEALARSSLRSFVSVIEDVLAPVVVGQDPFEVERLGQQMFRVFTGRTGGLVQTALSAIDIALWDLMGKATGQPVHRLLGSMGRDRIPAYASSVSWGSDETAIAQTTAAVARGFSMIKIKIGPPVEKALVRAKLVREVAGAGVKLCADGNCAFDFDDSIHLAHGLRDLDYFWLEEPMIIEDNEGYHRLRQQMPIRLAAGEGRAHCLWLSRSHLPRIGRGDSTGRKPFGRDNRNAAYRATSLCIQHPLRAPCRLLRCGLCCRRPAPQCSGVQPEPTPRGAGDRRPWRSRHSY